MRSEQRQYSASDEALDVEVSFDGATLGAHQLTVGAALGIGAGTAYPLAEAPFESEALAVCGIDQGGAFLQFLDGSEGVVHLGGEARSLAQLVAERRCPRLVDGLSASQSARPLRRYALPRGARATVQVGPLTVAVRDGRPAPRLGGRRSDWSGGRALAVAALVPLAFLGIAFSLPPQPAMASSDSLRLDERTLRAVTIPAVTPPPPPSTSASAKRDKDAPRARGPAGRKGDPKTHAAGHFTIAGNARTITDGQRRDARAIAMQAGVVGILGTIHSGPLAGLLDEKSDALGDAAATMNGNLDGLTAGPGWGENGNGLVGHGPGGGCTGPHCADTIQVGSCIGAHCGDGHYGHVPRVGLPERVPHSPVEIIRTEVKVSNGFDREMIRRVIRSHMNEIRFCYEHELATHPELQGKLTVGFVIGSGGRVINAAPRESTLADAAVAACVVKAVARLEFPFPAGSGVAEVQYPFIFRAAGESAP